MSEEQLKEIHRKLDMIIDRLEVKAEIKQIQLAEQKKPKKMKKGIYIEEEIEYEGKIYNKFTTCKYNCGYVSAWGKPYEKGDRKLHMNPSTKEIIGLECPAFEEAK